MYTYAYTHIWHLEECVHKLRAIEHSLLYYCDYGFVFHGQLWLEYIKWKILE
jgi:hypothetical protein